MDSKDFPDIAETLHRTWQIEHIRGEILDREVTLEVLAERVDQLLNHDFQRLITALYLLDVSEAKFNAALATPSRRERARRVAEIILDREIEKAISRERFRRGEQNSLPNPDHP